MDEVTKRNPPALSNDKAADKAKQESTSVARPADPTVTTDGQPSHRTAAPAPAAPNAPAPKPLPGKIDAPPQPPPPDGSVSAAPDATLIFFDDAVLTPSAENPTGIDLQTHHPRVPRTTEAHDLLRDIFAVEHVIRVLFSEEEYIQQRRQFFKGLLTTTKAGLCGPDYDIATGRLDLALTQDEIADAFPLLRDALWRSYLKILAILTPLLGVIGCVVYYHLIVKHGFADHNQTLLTAIPVLPQIVLALVWIPAAVPVGIFLEFVFRVGENLSYDGLLAINPGRWKPWRRTISTLITAYAFAFIIGLGVFQIGIAGILLNDFITKSPWLSLAIGFVTGFAYPYVRDIVTQFKPERRDAPAPALAPNTAAGNGKKG